MKILLKNILEKTVVVIFCLVIMLGNIVVIYNIKNKFVNIDEKCDIVNMIDTSKYLLIKDIKNEKNIEIRNDSQDGQIKNDIKEKLKNIKVRDSKLNLIDKTKEIYYTIYIINSQGNEVNINFSKKELKINNKVYETDYNTKVYFDEIFNRN